MKLWFSLYLGILSAFVVHADPSGIVFGLAKTNEGYLWAGSVDGLYRQEGRTWHTYDQTSTDITLKDPWVEHLYADPDGSLWVGGFQGGVMQVQGEKVLGRWLAGYKINVVLRHPREQAHYIGTHDGLFIKRGEQWVQFLKGRRISGLAFVGDLVVVGTTTGLYSFTYQAPTNSLQQHSHDYVRTVFGIDDEAWVGLKQGLGYYDIVQQKVVPVAKLSMVQAIAPAITEVGHLWLGTEQGELLLWNRKTQQVVPHRYHYEPSGRIHQILQDNSGIVWLATDRSVQKAIKRPFELHALPAPNLKHERVAMTTDDQQRLYVLMYHQGLWVREAHAETWQALNWVPASLWNTRPTMMFHERGFLWVATIEGIYRLDLVKKQWRLFKHEEGDERSLTDNLVLSMAMTRNHQLLVGTNQGGLHVMNPETGEVTLHLDHESHGLASNEVAVVRELSNGSWWLGTAKGYAVYDPKTQTLRNYPIPGGLTAKVMDIQEMDQHVWLTSLGAGIFAVDSRAPQTVMTVVNRQHGLPSNSVLQAHVDPLQRQLWLLLRDEVVRFDPSSGQVFSLRQDGEKRLYFQWNMITSGGVFYAASTQEIIHWQPTMVQPSAFQAPLVITNIKVMNQERAQLTELGYQDKTLRIEYAALDYKMPERNQYMVKLEGFDTAWRHVGNQRHAEYTNLPAGNYVFHVKGSNSDGVWNKDGVRLPFTVKPAPWATWWARMLYGLGLVGLFLGYRRFLIAKTKRLATIREIEREHVTQRQRVGGVIEKEVLQGLEVARNMPLHVHVSSELRRLSYHLREAVAQLRLEDVDTEGLLGALMVYGRQCTQTKVQVYHRGYQNDGLDRYARYAMAQFFMYAIEYAKGETLEATLVCEAQATRLRLTPMELIEDTIWESFTRRVSAYGKAVREGGVLEIILRNATLPEPSEFDHEEDENDGE